MRIYNNNIEELTIDELSNIKGGGFFNDLGAAAHEAWCTLQEAFQGDGTRYEAQGYGHYGGARP